MSFLSPKIPAAPPTPAPPVPIKPAQVLTPAGVDAQTALQYRAAAASQSDLYNKMRIPLSNNSGGTGISIPL